MAVPYLHDKRSDDKRYIRSLCASSTVYQYNVSDTASPKTSDTMYRFSLTITNKLTTRLTLIYQMYKLFKQAEPNLFDCSLGEIRRRLLLDGQYNPINYWPSALDRDSSEQLANRDRSVIYSCHTVLSTIGRHRITMSIYSNIKAYYIHLVQSYLNAASIHRIVNLTTVDVSDVVRRSNKSSNLHQN